MKKIVLVFFFSMLLASCSTPHEEQLDVYCDAVEAFHETNDIKLALANILEAERKATKVYALLSEDEKADFVISMENEDAKAVAVMRDSLLRLTVNAFQSQITHFIEKRTILYSEAVNSYSKANSIEELNAVEEIVATLSAMAYVDGERACDPPANVREKYKNAQDSAAKAYSDAEQRVTE